MSNSKNSPPIDKQPSILDESLDPIEVVEAASGEKKPSIERSVAKSAGIVSAFVMISRIFGLVREQIFAAFFGAGFLKDAFAIAFRIPNLLRDLFAEGALSAAFVKVFTDYQTNVSEKEAWRLAALVFNLLAIFLSAIVILGIIFSPLIVSMMAPGFSPEKAELTVWLTRIMFSFILFVSLSAVAMGVLNTKGNFAIPASASTAFNIVSIGSGVALAYYLSGGDWDVSKAVDAAPPMSGQWAITGMAIGTLFGGIAQLVIQLPSLHKVGFRFKPLMNFRDKGLIRLLKLMIPALIATSGVQLKVFIDSMIISGIDGGVSNLGYSFRLMQFPLGAFGVAIGIAALPQLAKYGSQQKIKEFRSTLANSIGLVFLLTVPSAFGLIVLGEPIVRLIYERGVFDANATHLVHLSLVAYSIGLAGYAAMKVLTPSFFALEDAKTPMYVSLGSIAVHLVLSYSLKEYFLTIGVTPENPYGYGHVGPALATSIVATANFLVLLYLMRRKIKRIQAKKILSSFLKIVASSVAMSVVCYFSYQYLTNYFGSKVLFVKLVETFVPIVLGGITFILCAKILKINELNRLLGIFKKRLAK